MSGKNALHKAIYEKVIRPELSKISYDAEAIITGVDYYKQTADVQWTDYSSGAFRTAKNLTFPKDGDGIYRQTPKVGDRVRLAFKNGNHAHPYISMIYRHHSSKDEYRTKSGSSMPRGVGF